MRLFPSSLLRLLCLFCLCLGTLHAQEADIKIGTLHGQMKFDTELIQVKPGAKVRLTLTNTDEMQHNLLIVSPGGENKHMEVAQRAWALGPDAVKKAFVPDGPDVLFHTKVLDPQQSETITFTAPAKEGDYPYVCTLPGHAVTMKGIMRVSAKAPAAPAPKPAPKGEPKPSDPKFFAVVTDEPLVIRAFVEGGPARSVSVGLPGDTNFLFDSELCYVRFGWSGAFLDVGPNVGTGAGSRGGGWCKILGKKFELGDSGFPLSLGSPDSRHTVKFAGYRMRGKEVPQFFFTVDGNKVTQTITAAPKGGGLTYEFEFEKAPGKVFFYASPFGLELSSSAGTWESGRLEVPADKSSKFSVTVARKGHKHE